MCAATQLETGEESTIPGFPDLEDGRQADSGDDMAMDLGNDEVPAAVKRDSDGNPVRGRHDEEEQPPAQPAGAVPPGFDPNSFWAQMQSCVGGTVKKDIAAVVTRLGRLERNRRRRMRKLSGWTLISRS